MRVVRYQHDYELWVPVVSPAAVNLTRIMCAMVTKKEKNSDQDIAKLLVKDRGLLNLQIWRWCNMWNARWCFRPVSQEQCGWSFQSDGVLPSKINLFIQILFCFRPKYFEVRLGSLLSSSYVEPNIVYNIILSIMLEQGVTIQKYLIWKKDCKGEELVDFALVKGQGSHLYPKRDFSNLHPSS